MALSSYPDPQSHSVFRRKWAGFVAAIWLMVFSGNYAFSNYSQALKEVLSLNQKSLNWLSIARDIGDAWGGILAGILSNHLPAWALLCISATLGITGYGVQWLVVSRTIEPLPYWIVATAAMIAGTCIAWINSAVFNATVRNFTRNSGPVTGLFKACMGLSGAVFATLCNILFSSSASMYLIMMVTFPNFFCILSAIFFRPVPTAATVKEEQFERKSLVKFNIIASALAVYIVFLDFAPSEWKESFGYRAVAVSILASLIGSPALVPIMLYTRTIKAEYLKEGNDVGALIENEEEEVNVEVRDSKDELLSESMEDMDKHNALKRPLLDESDKEKGLKDSNVPCDSWRCWGSSPLTLMPKWAVEGLGEDTPTLSLFRKWHYCVLYISLFFGCGAGVSFSNNLGQIGQALGFSSANLFVSCFSLGNFFGRLASGIVSEYFVRVAAVPRTAWMGVAKVPMIGVFLWLATGSGAALYVGSMVLGFSNGALITLTIPIVSEFYGLKHFGTNFVLTVTYLVSGSYVFSSVAGVLYDRQLVSSSSSAEVISLTCYGSACYGSTFLILALCLTVGLAFDATLTLVSRSLYQKLRASRTE
ncbi:hypothetical protein L7F22_004833 [Adiantum nelumboides]|nr:hypothetical protein [Adiantum nelumboides]